jgi:3-polyprenyl-4-hydroxybenzoate decarboxylase
VTLVVAGTPLRYDESEYEMAGALRGAPAPIAAAPLTGFDVPWGSEVDYLIGPPTCVPLYQQLRKELPEVQAVNAMYTHGLLAIISTRKRYGGFAKAVGMRAMTLPHGLGYCKVVIDATTPVAPDIRGNYGAPR